jgi:glycosyltransferase involved in cell wall biosynthesis
MQTRTLYICYFGLREPLVQTQVLPYLRELVAAGVGVDLLTFESRPAGGWPAGSLSESGRRLADEGIGWFRLPYHKRPSLPATAYDVGRGAICAARLFRERDTDLVHARSHVAAVMAAAVKRLTGRPFVFDIRGFLPEEYVDAGVWSPGGLPFRVAKLAERRLLDSADGFVVLTEKAREVLFGGRETDGRGRPVEVIPCCVDLRRFRAASAADRDDVREELGLSGRRVVSYVGALGGWYLTEEMADFFAAARAQDPSTFALILTQSPPELIEPLLRARGLSDEHFLVRRAAPERVPFYLRAADLAISFIKPCYSKLSSSPTKLAEYLASGLPVVCNAGVGDVDALVEGERVGVVVRELSGEAYRAALGAAEVLRRDPGRPPRCRAAAERHFDLRRVGGERYRRLYERVLRRGDDPLCAARGAGGGRPDS